MSKHAAYAPKHRAPVAPSPLVEAPKKAVRTTIVLCGLAAAATSAAVAGGVVLDSPTVAAAADLKPVSPATEITRTTDLSRSEDRAAATAADKAAHAPAASQSPSPAAKPPAAVPPAVAPRAAAPSVDPAKAAALAAAAEVAAVTQTENVGGGDPKAIASALLSSFGWSGSQFGCLESLWNRESGWRTTAANPSGAYGIPQALPGSKMASAGPNWQTDAETQIKWGLGYIAGRYGSPCAAWGHSQATGWY